MTIAVDFDGTIVEHRYPEIGRERTMATETLKRLQRENPDLHLILWTVREGELLDQAVEWCRKRGLEFYAVNSNYTDEPAAGGASTGRKVTADIYIDDRNLGGFPGWMAIYDMVTNHWSYPQFYSRLYATRDSRDRRDSGPSFFRRLFGR